MFDLFRQLYLLLWKNVMLKKRTPIRVVVEILWPLVLFLILMWVRTRGLRSFENRCHFAERSLPSSGLLPFLRSYICELNNSCSNIPRESYYNDDLYQLTQLSTDTLEFVNQQEVISSATTIAQFTNTLLQKREEAAAVTGNLTLSQSIFNDDADFKQKLTDLALYPNLLNDTVVQYILDSNPNYNYLYSNYSKTFSEPMISLSLLASQGIIDILYGPDLDRLDVNRKNNLVNDPSWVRSQICSSTPNLLLRGKNSDYINSVLCGLSDDQLTSFFKFVSSDIDFTKVKRKVYKDIYENTEFVFKAIEVLKAINTIKNRYDSSNLKIRNQIQSINDFIEKFQNISLDKSMCGKSQLSLFTIVDSLKLGSIDVNGLINFLNSKTSRISKMSSLISNSFELDARSFKTTENLGRQKSFRLNKKTNPFEFKSSAKSSSQQQTSARANPQTVSKLDMTTILRYFNNLNKKNASQCPAKRVDADLDTATQLYINSTTKTCFCQTVYMIINSLSQDSRVLFGQIKPMFLGKILYSPNTPAYNRLVKRINSTFENVDNLANYLTSVADIAENLLVTFNLTDDRNVLAYQKNLTKLLADYMNFNLTESGFDLSNYVSQIKYTIELLRFIRNSIGCIELNKFEGYPNEQELVSVGTNLIDKESFWGGIVFQNPEEFVNGVRKLPKIVKYKIRMNSSQTHDTTYTQDRLYSYSPSNCMGCNSYFLYGFIYLQDILEKGIIEEKTNQTQEFGIVGQMRPYPCYVNDKFVTAISRTLPLFMVIAWIYTVSMMVKDIVYEKEKRLKEFMRVMGLNNGTHWLSWFITSFTVMYFVTVILAFILKYGKITTYTELTVLLVFFCCFTIATITQCFLISVFFNKANLAAVVAGIVYFILYLPYTILVNYSEVMLPWQKFLASLSSTVAFSYGCDLIATFELQTKGVQWSNFYQNPYVNKESFSMNTVCLILLFDGFIYMILTWYIEGIAPGEFGIPRKWYFPVQPSYWCGNRAECKKKSNPDRAKSRSLFSKLFANCFTDSKQDVIEKNAANEEIERKKNPQKFKMLDDAIEKGSIDEKAGIEIIKLHKVYSRGNNHALKGLTVKFYENEISAFLGHNGAGKSTTMHLLTGLYPPTSGTAKINGHDISDSMDTIRKSLGFVPQHNVLFDTLTVKEHLWFYARLKGLDRLSTLVEMEKLLDDTGLRPKKSDMAKNLSGGMQRKLSVAIAFVGGSKTVILDEPSAGVDPSGRRGIWDLLFKNRKGRTIVISTHHMDEADVLGDRIAIISNGKLISHGTGYFLKNKFGRGYYLTFAKSQRDDDDSLNTNEAISSSSSGPSSDSGARSLSTMSDSKSSASEEHTYDNKVDTSSVMPNAKGDILNMSNGDDDSMESFEEIQRRNEENALKTLITKQDKNIHEFVKHRIENAVLVQNIGSEMTFSISNKPEFTKNYEKFFHQLELNMDKLAIDSIGISDTTLEEIFIKLAKEPQSNSFKNRDVKFCGVNFSAIKNKLTSRFKKAPPKKLTQEELNLYSGYTKLRVRSKFELVFQQLYALLIKRVHRVKRNVKGFFAEIVLPVVFVCLALLVATLTPKLGDRPALELHPWYYGSINNMFISMSSSFDFDRPVYSYENSSIDPGLNTAAQSNYEKVKQIVDTFYQNPGPGTRCMKGHKVVITKQVQDYYRAGGDQTLDCENYDFNYLQNYTMPPTDVINELRRANFSYTKTSAECDCSNGFPECPKSAGGDILYRPVARLRTTDYMYDLSGRNMSDWLIKTEFSDTFFRRRFGGYEFLTPYVNPNDQLASNLFSNINKFTQNLALLAGQFSTDGQLNLSQAQSTSIPVKEFFGSNPLISNQNVKIWYNTKGYDSSVSYLNVMNNAILRSKINLLNKQNGGADYLDPAEHGIVAFNHPMKFTRAQFISQLETRVLIDLFVAICIIFALSFIPSSFLVFLLEERETNSKQLQFVSGIKPYIYWISNFIWDLINYVVPCILCIIIFVIFDVKTYMSKENFPCLVALMLLYGWACIPLVYPLNYLFKVPSTAFVVSSSMNVFIGVVSTMTTTVLSQLGEDEPDLLQINNILKPIFIILFPHYSLGQGFIQMAYLYNYAEARRSFGYVSEYDPFEFNNVGRNLIAMAVQGFIFFVFNLLVQYKFFINFRPSNYLKKPKSSADDDDEDDDVVTERKRILEDHLNSKMKNRNGFNFMKKAFKKQNSVDEQLKPTEADAEKDYIKLVNLTKVYSKFKKLKLKKHVAVNSLSLGINKGECFGLIGVNGAGKTTTFKMITGEISPSAGDVYVNDFSVTKQLERVHENIGYCPQSDAIMPLLTAREHLIFFGRLRGIPEKYVKQASEWAMNRVGLNVFADRISGDFSGGNKRKLSTAIALVGDPRVICLDEPTSGMDAKARRLLWNDILSLIKENRIVVLTSHSMEECEALCTRLVIMVNGKFKCLGSPQHLKTKFGNGYKLAMRLNDENDKDKLIKFMAENFPSSINTEVHKNLLEYVLPFSENKLSQLFGRIESNREYLNIIDYSVSQTTLDQIFVNFAKGQTEDAFADISNNADNAVELGFRNKLAGSEFAEKDSIELKNVNKLDETPTARPASALTQTRSENVNELSTNNDNRNQYYDSNNNLKTIQVKPEEPDSNQSIEEMFPNPLSFVDENTQNNDDPQVVFRNTNSNLLDNLENDHIYVNEKVLKPGVFEITHL